MANVNPPQHILNFLEECKYTQYVWGMDKKHKALDPKLTILHTVMVTLTYFNLNSTYDPELNTKAKPFQNAWPSKHK